MDELDAAIYNALHGYYRQSISCLRNTLELVVIGTYLQIANNKTEFKQWSAGQIEISFGKACDHLRKAPSIQSLNLHLNATLNDSIFDQKTNTKAAGWTRRLYSELSQYTHSRLKFTNVGMWQSNGPIYVSGAFSVTASLYAEVSALSYLLIRLARPNCILPNEFKDLFKSYRRRKDNIAYVTYRYLFDTKSI